MKRPEGFDPPAQPASRKGRGVPSPSASGTPAPRSTARKAEPVARKPAPTSRKITEARQPPTEPAPRRRPRADPHPDAAARADLRRAARERRRVERAEVRKFTRRARNRRVAIASVAGVLLTLVILVLTAVYSPILALRTLKVDGTSRLDAKELIAATEGQLGTPLALVDSDRITRELAAFPLIRSYVTQIVPPDTLVIHVTERQPVGTVQVGSNFNLVDPAGIVVQQSPQRIPGVPLINTGAGGTSSPAFAAAVEVLIALPPELLTQVDSLTATTKDDVSLALTGVGQSVKWGSARDSDKKATLLAALISVNASRAGTFDVSAPSNGVFRPS